MKEPTSHKNYKFYLFIFFLILITISIAVFFKKIPGGTGHDGYIEIAKSIAEGKGFSINDEIVTGRAPIYPYLLSIGIIIGFEDWSTWIINFSLIFLSAFFQKKMLDRYYIKNSTLISILISCNPLILWLSTNSMPYPLSAFLISATLYGLTNEKYLISSISSLFLFFSHPSFGVISILLFITSIYLTKNLKINIVLSLFFIASIISSNIQIKTNYGDYPIFSTTGSGFQYLRARNQYLKGNFDDDSIFASIDTQRNPNDIYFSVVTNKNNLSLKIDKFGKETLVKDISNPIFFTEKFIIGIYNTIFGGLMPDAPIIFILISLIFYFLKKNLDQKINIEKECYLTLVLSLIFILHLALVSIIGFKMRYSAYFLPMWHFFPVVFLTIHNFIKSKFKL